MNPPRLGQTLAQLPSRQALYVDFTGACGMRNKQPLCGEVRRENVRAFFDAVLNGRRGDSTPGLAFDNTVGAWRAA